MSAIYVCLSVVGCCARGKGAGREVTLAWSHAAESLRPLQAGKQADGAVVAAAFTTIVWAGRCCVSLYHLSVCTMQLQRTHRTSLATPYALPNMTASAGYTTPHHTQPHMPPPSFPAPTPPHLHPLIGPRRSLSACRSPQPLMTCPSGPTLSRPASGFT
jgi:hypothetical protein